MKKRTYSRIISFVLVLIMLVSMVPALNASAEAADASPTAASEYNTYAKYLESIKPENNYGLTDTVNEGKILQAWNWSYENAIVLMETVAKQGFTTIQISPPNEIKMPTKGVAVCAQPAEDGIAPNGWWMFYQPAGFQINESEDNALGTKAQFVEMCAEAKKYGIKILVDAVVNHMGSDDDHIGLYDNDSTDPMDHVNPRAAEFEPELIAAKAFHSPWTACQYIENLYHGTEKDIEESLTQHAVSGFPDLATETQLVQDTIYDYLVELVESGASGFRFDDAKHIETKHDTYFPSDFWENTLLKLRAENPDKEIFAYGEIYNKCGDGRPFSEYTELMDVTDSSSFWGIKDAVCNIGNGGNPLPKYPNTNFTSENVIQWNESYDTYIDGGTSYFTIEQRNKIWALTAARHEITGVYFARPIDEPGNGRAQIEPKLYNVMLGDANLTSWTLPEVAAVNQFDNFFGDAEEYTSKPSKTAIVTRIGDAGVGATVVNLEGTTRELDVKEKNLPAGNYVDAITGNTFVAADGRLTGWIGDTGIAVLYYADDVAPVLPDAGTITDPWDIDVSNGEYPVVDGYYTVVFSTKWDSASIYYWSDSEGEMVSWPGTPMKWALMNDYGENQFVAYIPSEYNNYIINNNGQGEQTIELYISESVGMYMAEKEGDKYTIGTWDPVFYDWAPATNPTTQPTYPTEPVQPGSEKLEFTKISDSEVAVSGYTGDYNECVVIPSRAMGYNVTVIASGAFSDAEMVRVHIPESVTVIEDNAFAVDDIHIAYEGSIEKWKAISIGDGNDVLFEGARHYNIATPAYPGDYPYYAAERKDPTCISEGYTIYLCDICSDTFNGNYTDKVEHNYEEKVVPPTCKEQGYTLHTCIYDCGTSYMDNYVEIGDHKVANGACVWCGDKANIVESDHDYAANEYKTWTVQYEGAEYIDLTFSAETKVEKNYDYIYIYGADGVLVDKYTGTELASRTIRVEGSFVKIRLVSDASGQYYGFRATYAPYPADAEFAGGETQSRYYLVGEDFGYEDEGVPFVDNGDGTFSATVHLWGYSDYYFKIYDSATGELYAAYGIIYGECEDKYLRTPDDETCLSTYDSGYYTFTKYKTFNGSFYEHKLTITCEPDPDPTEASTCAPEPTEPWIPDTTATVATNPDVQPSGTYKIYFEDSLSWGDIHAYCYGGDGEVLGTWPGTACAYEGSNIWSVELNGAPECIIFHANDKTNQTSNLIFEGSNKIAKLTGEWIQGDYNTVAVAVFEEYGGGLSSLPDKPDNTYRYFFYMPPEWLNESTATTGNTAGIYWWEGTDAHGAWPGIAATPADVDGVYYCDVPTDVTTIVWNNFFDGGADATAPYYADASQTRHIGTEYYDPDESELYPDGTENFDGMIFVTDFTIYDFNDYSKKLQFGGEWFYYYGNGEYGVSPARGESEIFTDYATNNHLSFPKDGNNDPDTTEPVQDSWVDGDFTFENKELGVTIIGYSGDYSEYVIIPEESMGLPVTAIASDVFADAQMLRVYIPTSITVIEDNAFTTTDAHIVYGGTSSQWKSITIGEGNEIVYYGTRHYNGAVQAYEQTMVEATCKEGGHTLNTCIYCDDNFKSDLTGIGDHSYEAEVTPPTCQQGGYTQYTCSVCGDFYTGDYTDPVDHNVVDGECTYCHQAFEIIESDHDYAPDTDTTWEISKPGADSITLTFSANTYVEQYYDFIFIYDANGKQIGRYTGSELAGVVIEVEGDYAEIRLTSDDGFEYYGFRAQVTATYSEPLETYTIYFTKPEDWADAYIYGFYGEEGDVDNQEDWPAAYPGAKMNFFETNEYGQEVYTYEVPADIDFIKFNDGYTYENKRTVEIPASDIADGRGYYISNSYGVSSNRWEVGYYDTIPEVPTEPTIPTTPTEPDPNAPVVYFVNTANWAEVVAYTFNAETLGGWPGTKMTKTGETVHGWDIYKISVPGTFEQIIFNDNNNGSQTENLDFAADKYYDAKGNVYNNVDDIPAPDNQVTNVFLAGSFNGWSATANEFQLTAPGAATSVVTLDLAANTTYQFKVVRNGSWTTVKDFSSPITGSVSGLVFSSSGTGNAIDGNTEFKTTVAGTYTFTWNDSNLDITYPATNGWMIDIDGVSVLLTDAVDGVYTYTVELKPSTDGHKIKLIDNTGATAVNYGNASTFTDETKYGGPPTVKPINMVANVAGLTLKTTGGMYEIKVDVNTYGTPNLQVKFVEEIDYRTSTVVYFIKPAEWDAAYIFLMNEDLSEYDRRFPGHEMTHVEGDLYSFEVPSDVGAIKFKNSWADSNSTVENLRTDNITDFVAGVYAAVAKGGGKYTPVLKGDPVEPPVTDPDVPTDPIEPPVTEPDVPTEPTDPTVPETDDIGYYVVFVDYNDRLISAQSVKSGEAAVAPDAPARKGYNFVGWDTEFDCVTENLTVKAVYEKIPTTPVPAPTTGALKVEVVGGTGFTISVDGGNVRPQGPSYMNSKMPIGAQVTVVAKSAAGAEFIGWQNSVTGAVLSTDAQYTFVASGNDSIKAVFAIVVEGVQMVTFKNDKSGTYGRVLDSQYYAAEDTIQFPDAPTQVGFDFAGWSMTEEEIKSAIANGQNVTVVANWTRAIVPVKVTVNGGTGSGTYNANSAVTAVANEAPAGQKFAYWTDSKGNIKSYSAEYKFFPSVDTEVTAVFVAEDAVIDYQILVDVDSIDTVTVEGKNVFYFSWYCPEDFTFVKSGILAVNKDNYNESTFVAGTSDGNVYDRSPSGTDKAVNSTSWTKSNVTSGQTWRAMAYVQYRDADGALVTVYSDMVEAIKD